MSKRSNTETSRRFQGNSKPRDEGENLAGEPRDTVELLPENLKGRAVDRNLMFTVLAEDDGSFLQVPNNLFFQKIFRVARS